MKPLIQFIRRLYNDAPIARKVGYITILSSVITLLLLSSAYVVRNWMVFKEEKLSQLETLGGIIASASQAALVFNDTDAADEYTGFLAFDSTIQTAVLYDAEDRPLSVYSRLEDYQAPPPPSLVGAGVWGERLSYADTIRMDGRKIGTIFIQLDPASPKTFLLHSFGLALALLIGGTCVTILMASRFRTVLTDPITQLAWLAKDISMDNDYSKRAIVRYRDEVGSLAESFNGMLTRIQERENALRDIQYDLEMKVKERTQELEKTNETLMQARDEARSASQAKGNFLSVMSHELRTPMNAIIGMSGLLDDASLSSEKHEAVDIIRKSSNSLLNLVDNILDYSKIESGRLEIERAPFDLYACLIDPITVVAAQSNQPGLSIIVDCSVDLPKQAIGDSTRLSQIVTNLLSNAVKFTAEGHVLMQARLDSDAPTPTLEIRVEDSGIGIPADRLPLLFQHFSQVDSSTTRKYGGTGLGLAISQRLAIAMGGGITVESTVEVGTCFTARVPLELVAAEKSLFDDLKVASALPVQLVGFEEPSLGALKRMCGAMGVPLQPSEDSSGAIRIENCGTAPISAIKERLELMDAEHRSRTVLACHPAKAIEVQETFGLKTLSLPICPHNLARLVARLKAVELDPAAALDAIETNVVESMSILLVEDSLVNQKVFLMMMRRAGHAVDTANHGAEALEALETREYDLVFMDYRMPVMDGLDATLAIRERYGWAMPPYIVGLTANAEPEVAARLVAAGMNACLTKPVRSSQLEAAVSEYLDWRQSLPRELELNV